MEVMDTSLDKFYKLAFESGKKMPEEVLGKIAVAVSIFVWSIYNTFFVHLNIETLFHNECILYSTGTFPCKDRYHSRCVQSLFSNRTILQEY